MIVFMLQVLTMFLPLILLMILPKLINTQDPEMQRVSSVTWHIDPLVLYSFLPVDSCSVHFHFYSICQMRLNEKSARRRRKHCASCSKAEPKNFHPASDPLPGGAGRPKFNQLEMVTTFTYKPSLVRIDAHNFELSW